MNKYSQHKTNAASVSASLTLPLGTIGFITWLVFLIIKLTTNPEWLTWFWVWFPFWLPWAIAGAELVLVGLIILIAIAIASRR